MNARKHRIRTLTALAATAGALTLIACGDDDGSSTSTSGEAAVSADQAVVEIGAVRDGLAATLAAYEDGDAAQAEELATDAYLEHFELVEGPLEEVDAELTEELEELIREQLRAAISAGRSPTKVAALIEQAQGDLDKAESELQGAAG